MKKNNKEIDLKDKTAVQLKTEIEARITEDLEYEKGKAVVEILMAKVGLLNKLNEEYLIKMRLAMKKIEDIDTEKKRIDDKYKLSLTRAQLNA